jgi:predicted dehydrogenase
MIRPDEGEAALFACEALMHVLVDKGLVAKADIAEALEDAAEAKLMMVEDGEGSRHRSAALLLEQLARSIRSAPTPPSIDLPEP